MAHKVEIVRSVPDWENCGAFLVDIRQPVVEVLVDGQALNLPDDAGIEPVVRADEYSNFVELTVRIPVDAVTFSERKQ